MSIESSNTQLSTQELEVLAGIMRYAEVHSDQRVKNKQLAELLKMPPSVISKVMDILREKGYVEYSEYKGVSLTKEGEKAAALYLRKHRLLESFLVKVMGMNLSEAHEEASELVKVVSDTFISRIESLLNDTQCDPHGNIIPAKDGKFVKLDDIPLCSLSPGEHAVVTRIPLEKKELLEKFGGLGLVPNTEIVVKCVSLGGAMIVKLGETEVALDLDTASKIRVKRRDVQHGE
ncbi:MAG: metal-dependent transcriptional regulator [Candidatus Korarchaeota archaeon]